MKRRNIKQIGILLLTVFLLYGCGLKEKGLAEFPGMGGRSAAESVALSDIPEFSGEPYVVLNDNEPGFSEEDFTTESYEEYSALDSLGRCGAAEANIGQDLMPTEKRGDISQVKPTGWHSVKYDWVDGKSLYNRCHLIGFQLTAENANDRNLITGTRYMNVDGMLPFENMVADYIKETGNHVLYRVTPIFSGDNLVADGVQMEAKSVEDEGEGVCFHIFAYNVQPGVVIDYATGDSYGDEAGTAAQADNSERAQDEGHSVSNKEGEYVLNVNTHKFHFPSCSGAKRMKGKNREDYVGDRETLISDGYEPCGSCNP
ncbi:DNA/RNA non-specific endonuclease [Lachnospiraceae bacterium 46-15]